MVTILKKSASKNDIKKIISSIKKKEALLDASKYFGKINIKEDSLKIQKRLRNEWE